MPDDTRTIDPTDDRRSKATRATRRGALGLLGLGSLGLLTGQVSARPPDGGSGNPGGPIYDWQRDVDANGHAVEDLGSVAMTGNAQPITDFAGANLSVDAAGVLNAAAPGPNPSVSDDGTLVTTDVEDLDFGEGLSATDDGDGTVTVSGSTGDGVGGTVGPSVFLDFTEPFPEGTQQIIPYDAIRFDPRGEFDTATHGLTVDETGFYHVDAQAAISRASGGGDPVNVCVRLLVDGTIVANACARGGNDFFSTYGALSRVIELEAGETLEVHGFVVNELGTADYQVGGGAGNSTYLTVHRVG